MKIPEDDWQHFKKLREQALDRYCSTILVEAVNICNSEKLSTHDRFLELYDLLQQRNKDMKMPFDGLSRNAAPVQLKLMYDMKLVTDDEIGGFNDVMMIAGLSRGS